MAEIVKRHRMRVEYKEVYDCGESGCSGHVPAVFICSCGFKKEVDFYGQPDADKLQKELDLHTADVVKAAGFVFELIKPK